MSMAFAAEVRALLTDHEMRLKSLEKENENLRRLVNEDLRRLVDAPRKRGRPPRVKDDEARTQN